MATARFGFLVTVVVALAACGVRPPSSSPAAATVAPGSGAQRHRAGDLGVRFGSLPSGPTATITDVDGVLVGHHTLRGGGACTGVTVVLPHGGNPFLERVPAGVFVANGFGKPFGFVQVEELGELEAPIALTGTLNVPRVADGLLDHVLGLPGCERVRSVNPVVLETNDGRLNDLRSRPVRSEHVAEALANAKGHTEVGSVGAGTGTICFGYKGGIGSASRVAGRYTVGVLAQTNFGGDLVVAGVPIKEPVGEGEPQEAGSCAIVIATDAPLDARNLRRLAARSFVGMARTGASFSNGSGDYAIAFSTARQLRRSGRDRRLQGERLGNAAMTPLFVAVAEATEEAIIDSLCAAQTTEANGRRVEALPFEEVVARLRAAGR
ncbi:MAG: P1 family peptidase [Planctomycetota bacterium]|nr:P1 family peptidase [Planctomycetota bacterium]